MRFLEEADCDQDRVAIFLHWSFIPIFASLGALASGTTVRPVANTFDFDAREECRFRFVLCS